MIKKITKYLLQRRYALSLLFMLLILQPTLAQVQNPEMYARFDKKTRTLTFYYNTNKQSGDQSGDFEIKNQSTPTWDKEKYNIRIVNFDESFKNARPKKCEGWFKEFRLLGTINNLKYLNTSEVVSMRSMFESCKYLKSLDLSSFDTKNVEDMSCMFKGCERLEAIYVGDGFDAIHVGQSGDMFKNCKKINGAITYQDSSTDKYEANWYGYFRKKVGMNGDEPIGAVSHPLKIKYPLSLSDSKAFELYENCNVFSASYKRSMKSEWGTLCLPFTIDITYWSNTCNFYTLKNIGNESVVLMLIENGTVEAGQPVVIRNKDNTKTDISISSVNNTQVLKEPKNTNTGNRMIGTFTNMELADDCYFIANNQFRLVSSYKPATSGVKLAAFRAYIQPQKTNVKHAPSLNISVNDETTGIETSNVLDLLNDKDAEYYDVNGRRIQNLQKGINIVKKGNKTMKIVCR